MRTESASVLDRERLTALAQGLADTYRTAAPFPHIVVDDFFPESLLDEVLREFPGVDDDAWWRFDDDRERKLGSPDHSLMGPTTQRLFAMLNGPDFVDFLSELTGIHGLVPDPHLFGGGLHQIEPGGFLRVHADFNLHPVTRLERRLNVLLYLNRNWHESWGGSLELWAPDMSSCVEQIPPSFNRCVVFSTTDNSFHGHPAPLMCPAGTTRRSLALYYYSIPSAPAMVQEHNTIFPSPTAGTEHWSRTNGEPEGHDDRSKLRAGVRRLGNELIPPLVARTVKRLPTRMVRSETGSTGG
jgi:hypothetical protein